MSNKWEFVAVTQEQRTPPSTASPRARDAWVDFEPSALRAKRPGVTPALRFVLCSDAFQEWVRSAAWLPEGRVKRPEHSPCLQGGSRSRRVLPAPGTFAAELTGIGHCGVSLSPPSPAPQRQPEGAELPARVLAKKT